MNSRTRFPLLAKIYSFIGDISYYAGIYVVHFNIVTNFNECLRYSDRHCSKIQVISMKVVQNITAENAEGAELLVYIQPLRALYCR